MAKITLKTGLWVHDKTLRSVDGRTSLGKALKRVTRELEEAIGGDPSPQLRYLIGRCAFLIYRTMSFEYEMINGTPQGQEAGDYYLAWCNTLRKTLQAVGLKRIPKEATSLAAYIEEKYGNEEAPPET